MCSELVGLYHEFPTIYNAWKCLVSWSTEVTEGDYFDLNICIFKILCHYYPRQIASCWDVKALTKIYPHRIMLIMISLLLPRYTQNCTMRERKVDQVYCVNRLEHHLLWWVYRVNILNLKRRTYRLKCVVKFSKQAPSWTQNFLDFIYCLSAPYRHLMRSIRPIGQCHSFHQM